jgi:hypothetical protein
VMGYRGHLRVVEACPHASAPRPSGDNWSAAEPTPTERALVIGWILVQLVGNAAALGAVVGLAVVYETGCMIGRAAVRALEDG